MNRFILLAGTALAVSLANLHSQPAEPGEKSRNEKEPPLVQMLVPGFSARELPLELNNINNLVYAPDGRLFALCYDGNVLQLKDTDGDGLEDAAIKFFNNKTNEIPPSIGMCWGPGGLYIASQKRVIHLRDKGDGTCELKTVTEGWVPPTGKAGQSLDSIGIAADSSGNIFFGLGCDKWNEAYRVNTNTMTSEYNIQSERGTILKISPDWKKREIICTGMRFPVSLAFNSAGDLFSSEQEGATWLANGNPFDELLHIQPGRHYGFPPRHPKYLPNVIDEPSVFDYAPQHESTCGLHFNSTVGTSSIASQIFGPQWWRDDAFVSGESRGKIWRTKLVKTSAGYVAKTELIACLKMLVIDSVPTPDGDLLVTCHSGKPDWGTGPQGKGKLFKISYTNKSAPQPVLAYAASPTETRIIFDLPLDPAQFKNLTKQSRMTFGKYVAPGDRFEFIRPGYQVVKDQRTEEPAELPIFSASLAAGNRSIILQTAPRTAALKYAVTLPDPNRSDLEQSKSRREIFQHPTIDVLTDLTGTEAAWTDKSKKQNWNGWLPHLDLMVNRAFTAASEEHAQFFKLLKNPGTLILRAQINPWSMLHPAVQPGAKLDYEYPPETVTFVFKSNGKLGLKSKSSGKIKRLNESEFQIILSPKQNEWLPVEISCETGGTKELSLEVNWLTTEDTRLRALPLRRIFLPWATPTVETNQVRKVPEIVGGDWQRGKKVFFSEQAACFKCHEVHGEGGKIGPDLSNLFFRDYASVMKDINEPSTALNPDHLAFNIELKDGEMVTGAPFNETPENITVGQANGTTQIIPRSNIANMKASKISLMPEGLMKGLSTKEQKDLLTFLLMQPENKK